MYLSQSSQLKMVNNPQYLEEIFWHRETRKVSHMATISLAKNLYEVPPHFIGQRIEVRYDTKDLDSVFIFQQGKMLTKAKPVSLSDNSQAKRNKSSLSFRSIQSGKGE